ncbi:MAG: hypothetical protein MZW92_47180 [Comamonadaceae bacterium]|nr:hypothetical protein [Comamonadaceae bacterium]
MAALAAGFFWWRSTASPVPPAPAPTPELGVALPPASPPSAAELAVRYPIEAPLAASAPGAPMRQPGSSSHWTICWGRPRCCSGCSSTTSRAGWWPRSTTSRANRRRAAVAGQPDAGTVQPERDAARPADRRRQPRPLCRLRQPRGARGQPPGGGDVPRALPPVPARLRRPRLPGAALQRSPWSTSSTTCSPPRSRPARCR